MSLPEELHRRIADLLPLHALQSLGGCSRHWKTVRSEALKAVNQQQLAAQQLGGGACRLLLDLSLRGTQDLRGMTQLRALIEPIAGRVASIDKQLGLHPPLPPHPYEVLRAGLFNHTFPRLERMTLTLTPEVAAGPDDEPDTVFPGSGLADRLPALSSLRLEIDAREPSPPGRRSHPLALDVSGYTSLRKLRLEIKYPEGERQNDLSQQPNPVLALPASLVDCAITIYRGLDLDCLAPLTGLRRLSLHCDQVTTTVPLEALSTSCLAFLSADPCLVPYFCLAVPRIQRLLITGFREFNRAMALQAGGALDISMLAGCEEIICHTPVHLSAESVPLFAQWFDTRRRVSFDDNVYHPRRVTRVYFRAERGCVELSSDRPPRAPPHVLSALPPALRDLVLMDV